jgi:hypothetical protein
MLVSRSSSPTAAAPFCDAISLCVLESMNNRLQPELGGAGTVPS